MATNDVTITIKVDDKGTVQGLSSTTQKLGKDFEKVGNDSRTADRNIKGVAATSSNATKNFSKMSQGMGGLVGAYAAFAAQVFALTAAFNFLRSAGDLAALQAGQAAQAAAGGGQAPEQEQEQDEQEGEPEEGSQEEPVQKAVTDIPERIANI